jgi:hypothetical protein
MCTKRVVDEQLPHDQEHEERLERDAVRERARDQCRSDDREHHLVGDQHHQRDVRRRIHRRGRDVAQEGNVEVAVDAVRSAAEAQRVADQPPHDGGDGQRGEALDHDRERVRPPHQPAVEEREAGVINITRLAASNMKPVFASLIMFASFRDRRE